MNPECAEGKHRNCDGSGWDLEADAPAVCPCQCHRLPTERFRIGGVRGGRVEVEVVGGDVITVTLDQLDAIVGAHVAADEVVMARRRATTYALA